MKKQAQNPNIEILNKFKYSNVQNLKHVEGFFVWNL